MKNRRAFLAAIGAAGVSVVLEERAAAQSAAPSQSPPSAPALPQASAHAASPPPKVKPVSAVAAAAAAAMRRFDPKLSDADLEKIARAIDDNAKAATTLNPKKRRLRNADGPVTTFAAEPR